MEEKIKNRRREEKREFVITIGPNLKQVLDKQKENIKKVTYNCVKSSYYESGEILALKIIENKLI